MSTENPERRRNLVTSYRTKTEHAVLVTTQEWLRASSMARRLPDNQNVQDQLRKGHDAFLAAVHALQEEQALARETGQNE